MTRERILVVDDEAGVRSSLQGILEDEGYRVDTDSSAEGALKRLTAEQYDLVLLDVWLPKMDGMEALERMREEEIDTPVIVISGRQERLSPNNLATIHARRALWERLIVNSPRKIAS